MISKNKIKVLIVDDSALLRQTLSTIISSEAELEVIGTASDPYIAVSKMKSEKPDVITLDVEMPGMNGLQVLEEIRKNQWDVACIMISSRTQAGSEATIKALELGAFDFIAKPDETSAQLNIEYLSQTLGKMLGSVSRQLELRSKLRQKPTPSLTPIVSPKPPINGFEQQIINKAFKRTEKSTVVAIGISTGGPAALAEMLFPGNRNQQHAFLARQLH